MEQTSTRRLVGRPSGSESSDVPTTDCLVVYSGGSTGAPKQIVRPRQTWIDSATTEATVFGIGPTDRFAILGGQNHSLWSYAHFRADYLKSSCIGVQRVNRANLHLLAEIGVTVIYGVPEMVAAMLRLCKQDSIHLFSVRRILLGGGPVLPNFPTDQLQHACPMASTHRFYGSAETSFIAHAPFQGHYTPFPGVQVRIDDDQVIWVKSALTVSPPDWVATEDFGRWVDHQTFDVLGRKSRQVKVKGQKYIVEPVEHALISALKVSHLALLQDVQGRLHCVMASDEYVPSLKRINQAIRAVDSKFPLARSADVLPRSQWPLNQGGKTDWVALTQWLWGKTP